MPPKELANANPPNPWHSAHVEWIDAPPAQGLQVYEERAKAVLSENDSPDLGFRFSLNPYRGCLNACAYCLHPDTKVLRANGRVAPISDLRVGDEVLGTERVASHLKLVRTPVLAHWRTEKEAHRIRLDDGTELVSSGDHRFLTNRGWKFVEAAPKGHQRPFLTKSNSLRGFGDTAAPPPAETDEYRRGYLSGMIKGDGLLGAWHYERAGRRSGTQHQFRLALIDLEALVRSRDYLAGFEIETRSFLFAAANGARKALHGIRTHSRARVDRIRMLIEWPRDPSLEWLRGFLSGIFDAEGGYVQGVLRISNTDAEILRMAEMAASAFRFETVLEGEPLGKGARAATLRVRGGIREHLRFFGIMNPAITRKCSIVGRTLKKSKRRLQIVSVERLGVVIPMYDLTTGTGDFIANGVVSHNCYARPTHQYWDFGAGTDFERKIIAKVNAPEVLRAQLLKPSWKGDLVVFSGNTDCYQPLEASYELTRRCLEVMREFRNPVGIITKGALIRRDLDILQDLARDARLHVNVSLAFADEEMARRIEPGAPSPAVRLKALRALADAGISVGVGVAPIIPGLNDGQIAEVLTRARDAGATSAFRVMLRLPLEVKPVFLGRLNQAYPDRAQKVENAVREMRGGALYVSEFGKRGVGQGPRWEAIEQLFDLTCRKLGLADPPRERMGTAEDDRPTTFRRPGDQLRLF